MTINALNSGAKVWLADQEDANTPPNWQNVIGGQVSLYDANRDQIEYTSPEGKEYRLQVPYEQTPDDRDAAAGGWHLEEKHITVDGERMSGGVVDFGLYFFHNAEHLLSVGGRGPYFYLPKTESYLEARLWNDLFNHAEQKFGIPRHHPGDRADRDDHRLVPVGGDHLRAARPHGWPERGSVGLHLLDHQEFPAARGEEFVLPDRKQVTMTTPFMRSYTEQLVRACHRRGVHAIGGMAAFIPNRRDPQVTEKALAAVHEDKKREANDGFDGSWVAHPDLVPICREEFDAVLGDKPNQIDRLREDVVPDDKSLIDLKIEGGQITEAGGVRTNVEVGIRYLEAWLRGGNGAAGINNLMEDVATAEISRSQIWQWIHCGSKTAEGGQTVTRDWIEQLIEEEFTKLPRTEGGDKFDNARKLFEEVALADEYPAFLTIPPGYDHYLEN